MLQTTTLNSFIVDHPTSAHWSSLARLFCMRDIVRLIPQQPALCAVNPFHFHVDYNRQQDFSLTFIRVRYNLEPYYYINERMKQDEDPVMLLDASYPFDFDALRPSDVFPSFGRILAVVWGATQCDDEALTALEKQLRIDDLYLNGLFSNLADLDPELLPQIKQMLVSLIKNECSQDCLAYVKTIEGWIYRQMAFSLSESLDLVLLRKIEMHLRPIQKLLTSTTGRLRFHSSLDKDTNADTLLAYVKQCREMVEVQSLKVRLAPWMILFVTSMLSIDLPSETLDDALGLLEDEIAAYLRGYEWLKLQAHVLERLIEKINLLESLKLKEDAREVIAENKDHYKTYCDTGLFLFQSHGMRESSMEGFEKALLASYNNQCLLVDGFRMELAREARSSEGVEDVVVSLKAVKFK